MKLGVRRGEEKIACLLFSYFFLITTPHTIVKTLRTTDLLSKIGVGALPLAYLSAALVTALVVMLHSRIQFRISLQFLVIATLVFFVTTGLALQLTLETQFGRRSAFLPYVYWVWANVMIVMFMTHFGMTFNQIFNPREGKRLIVFISSGGILGGILGGFLAALLTRANRAIVLLPLACALLVGCIFVVRAIFRDRQRQLSTAPAPFTRREGPTVQKVGLKDSFNAVRTNSYLTLIAAIGACGIIVSTFIDFQFSSAAVDHFLNPKDMQAFFGFFFGGMPILAFFLNAFLTGNFIKRLGMKLTVLLTPLALLLCSLGFLIVPFSLIPAIFIKGSDESLDISLKQTVRELLYIPVVSDLRFKAKPFIEMFISRIAKVIAALILLVFALLLNKKIEYLTPVFDPGLAKQLSWIVLAFLIPWLVFSLKIGREYVAAINRGIKRHWERVDQSVTEQLDVEAAKDIFDTIDSRNRSATLYMMNLFDLLQQDKLTPEIRNAISEKAGELRASSLSTLFDPEGTAGPLETVEDVGSGELITNIREVISLDAYQELMKRHADRVMEESKKSEIEKMELAKAIGLMNPDAPLTDRLEALIDDDSSDVACYALKSAARLKKESYIPAIIRKLKNPSTREDAVSALHKYGLLALPALEENLRDTRQDLPLRRAVVEVLARFGTQAAVDVLAEELEQGGGELDSEIIDALDRIRSEKADVQFPAPVAKKGAFSLVQKYCRAFLDLQGLVPGQENEAVRREQERNSEVYFADIFKLLGLYYPHGDIQKAYQNIKTGTRDSVAYAIELLDNTLKKDERDVILSLVEDLSPAERRHRFEKILKRHSEG